MGEWEVIEFKSGDQVSTPFGDGEVRQVGQDGQAQVNINGQLFEVSTNNMTKSNKTTKDGEWERATKDNIKSHDTVRTRNHGVTGKVIRETQRSIYVKWDEDGGVSRINKSNLGSWGDGDLERKKNSEGESEEEQERQEKRQERDGDTVARDTAEDLYGLLNLKQKLEDKIESDVDQELKDIRDAVKHKQKLEVTVDGKTNTIEGLKHKQLEQLINYCALRLSPLMVGMAGTGKTHAGEQVAEALGLEFYSISVGAQTTKTDLMGYMSASGEYVKTHFRDAYENGGIFLMDEIDAGNANVLITVNAALSNGLAAFPDKMVKRHEDFVFIASANTFGNGANRQYVGRNQLDAATLDRFAIIEWDIDNDLEESLTIGLNGKAWYMAVRAARDYVAEKNIRALISPRATQKGSKLLDIGSGLDEVIKATLLGSVPEDKKQDVKNVAVQVFEKMASEVPGMQPSAVDLVKQSDEITEIDLSNIPF